VSDVGAPRSYSSAGPSAGLGDLIRAIAALGASDEEAAAIAVMLGMRPAAEQQPVMKPRHLSPKTLAKFELAREQAGTSPAADDLAENPAAQSTEHPAAPVASTRATGEAELELTFMGTATPPARSWISDAQELAEPALAATRSYNTTVPPFVPLLAPVITRAILAEAAATATSDGPIDIERLVLDVATRRPLRALPCLPATTLRRGAQILIDRTAAMQPFQVDTDDLAVRIRQVASQGATQLLYFDEDPTMVDDTWPVVEGRPYELPLAGTPIVLITDLGIRHMRSRRSHARSYWLAFAREARRRQCPVIAFVPYPPSRWPAGLDGLITPLPWDHHTTVTTVRTAKRSKDR